MSITITAMAIPNIVRSSWENIDAHLTRTDSWDWVHLRPSLVRAVCAQQRRCGIPVNADEELALIALYDTTGMNADG